MTKPKKLRKKSLSGWTISKDTEDNSWDYFRFYKKLSKGNITSGMPSVFTEVRITIEEV